MKNEPKTITTKSAAEAHGQHQQQDDDYDGFYQVDDEGVDGAADYLWLEEYLVEFHAGGDGLGLDSLQPGLHFLAYLDDVGARLGGDEQADGRLSVVLHGVAHGRLPAVGDIGHVGELELIVLMALYDEVAYVIDAFVGVPHLYLPISIFILRSGVSKYPE